MEHAFFMQHCRELANKGTGLVGLNPKVGAVLVRNTTIIAEGYHTGWGKPHAEVELLHNVIVEPTDIVYVNLEPCCHTGKTPPCTDILIQKGVKTVVYGMQDPNPKVAGQGIQRLQEAGIQVIGPMQPELCTRHNKGYVSVQQHARPYITLKSAQTSSGAFANEDGSTLKITTEKQNAWSHAYLRATHDAILVGVQTVLSDNPQLNCRVDNVTTHTPYRIVLDPDLRTPLDATIVTDDMIHKTIIVTTDATSAYAEVLQKRGVHIWQMPRVQGLFDFATLWQHCTTVTDNFYGIVSILVEGGPITWTTFRLADCRDEEVLLVGS